MTSLKLSLTIQTPEVQPVVPVALLSGTFAEKLEKAAAFGADGVELVTINPRALDSGDIADSLKKNRLGIAAIASGGMAFAAGLTLLNAEAEKAALAKERLYDLIDFARSLGAPLVTIGGFRGRVAWVGADGRQRLEAILDEGATYAASQDVRLVLEPINRFESDVIANAAEALAFIAEIGNPALGLLLDTFHVNIEESSWTEPFRRLLSVGKLWHVHLGDNNRLPPGDGLIDFPAIVHTLRECGYSGYLSAELLRRPDPDTAAQRTLSYMRSILGD